MKKIQMLFVGITSMVIVAVISGCAPGYIAQNSFPATPPALIYANTEHTGYIAPKVQNFDKMEILGDVQGSSIATNVLLLVAEGNSSVENAKKDALKRYPNADDIVNMEVTVHHTSILSLFTTLTTKVTGKAIKYKK